MFTVMPAGDPTDLTRRSLEQLRRTQVSRLSPEPRYLQAARAIEGVLGNYDDYPHIPMPGETDMAAALEVGRPTLRQALAHLSKQGRIYSKKGVGTFVAPAALHRPARLNSLYDDLKAQGLRPTTQVLAIETLPAPEREATELDIKNGQSLVRVRRVRHSNRTPVALIENYLNLPDGAELEPRDLESAGLYETLRVKFGIELAMASLDVSARLASAAERRILKTRNPAALLVARRLVFDTAGVGVEVGTTVYAEGADISGIRLSP
jgi:DNA-binding GntR family transcriptional regulator